VDTDLADTGEQHILQAVCRGQTDSRDPSADYRRRSTRRVIVISQRQCRAT